MNLKQSIKSIFKRSESYVLLIIIVFSAFVTMINPAFLTLDNLFDLLRSSSGTAILGIGVFLVLVSGGVDVSCTTIAIVSQYVSVNLMIRMGIDNIWFIFGLASLIGITLGAINAVFVSIFKLPTLIVTLGTSSLYHGAMLEFFGTRSVNVGDLPRSIKAFGTYNVITLHRGDGTPYGLSVFFVILLALLVITFLILKFTMVGRGVYAVGGNLEAAERAGFNTRKTHFFIYMYAGLLAGIMGVIHLSLIRYSNPNYIVGDEMMVIAAVVLGGARISGGSGTLTGTMLGVILVSILQKNLIMMGLSTYWQQFFIGVVLILGVSITYLQAKLQDSGRTIIVKEQE
ncbi:MAG: ABC transporter permease [Sphaerochaetaceae bacterium]|jgi:simple sugar transport system permease protein|nr:ABC transporter permease [Sphaerochaetaceae bacterium]